MGPLPSGDHLLVIIDDYSRYPVVDVISSTSTEFILPFINKTLCQFGIPETIRTDNGAAFISREFAQYADYMGFKHHKITPRHP